MFYKFIMDSTYIYLNGDDGTLTDDNHLKFQIPPYYFKHKEFSKLYVSAINCQFNAEYPTGHAGYEMNTAELQCDLTFQNYSAVGTQYRHLATCNVSLINATNHSITGNYIQTPSPIYRINPFSEITFCIRYMEEYVDLNNIAEVEKAFFKVVLKLDYMK